MAYTQQLQNMKRVRQNSGVDTARWATCIVAHLNVYHLPVEPYTAGGYIITVAG